MIRGCVARPRATVLEALLLKFHMVVEIDADSIEDLLAAAGNAREAGLARIDPNASDLAKLIQLSGSTPAGTTWQIRVERDRTKR
jgi:hypothetical protein